MTCVTSIFLFSCMAGDLNWLFYLLFSTSLVDITFFLKKERVCKTVNFYKNIHGLKKRIRIRIKDKR